MWEDGAIERIGEHFTRTTHLGNREIMMTWSKQPDDPLSPEIERLTDSWRWQARERMAIIQAMERREGLLINSTRGDPSKPFEIELPAEVWSRVMLHLLRKPPPLRSECEWSELHQQDLVNCLTVSKLFYECAIPHLYRTPIVRHLGSFAAVSDRIYDCDHSTKHNCNCDPHYTPPTFTDTKRSALRYVKTLHMVYDRPRIGPLYMDLIGQGGEYWGTSDYMDEDIRSKGTFEQVVRLLDDNFTHIFNLVESDINRMPNLVSLCTDSHYLNRSLANGISKDPNRQTWLGNAAQNPVPAVRKAHILSTVLLDWYRRRLSPATICLPPDHSPFGIIGQDTSRLVFADHERPCFGKMVFHGCLPHTIVPFIHIGLHSHNVFVYNAGLGVSKQWSDTGYATELGNRMSRSSTRQVQFELAQSGSRGTKAVLDVGDQLGQTRFDLYGLRRHKQESDKAAEKRASEMQKAFNRVAGPWKGRLFFHPYHHFKKCEGCGWIPGE